MEVINPMDRLICGDVGFGKTEIAVRAAFKAVADSKQVAILVPTTILAFQHYKSFGERLKDFPCKVEYLNRFKSAKEQKETLKELEAGKIDIIIATHRLIGKDVKFKDLGLLIIDEEQKFGVTHKERLREMKVNVDTLTLTATPIPRTLQFSLMGARDLSVINTPPPNRQPIQTELMIFNEETIRDAINFEVSRGGQVYFVHNRIKDIGEIREMILSLCPDVKVVIAHGQMEGKDLEKIMVDFIGGENDVLLSTSIIESGIDIPNVNTIVINNAHWFGLSDLHQLRGRVGRSNRKAFCYLISPPMSTLTSEARKRLKTIDEFSDLGSGFAIALRDLDIRGAGNLLGAEQTGFIAEVGLETFHKILDEAIQELKETDFKELFKEELANKTEFVKECQVETDKEILIPNQYVRNVNERLSLYTELNNCNTNEKLKKFKVKLIDRFGPLPKQVKELLSVMRLKWLAKSLGVEKMVLKKGKFRCYFISDKHSPFYESAVFTGILTSVQSNPMGRELKQTENYLILTFDRVPNVSDAHILLKNLLDKVTPREKEEEVQ